MTGVGKEKQIERYILIFALRLKICIVISIIYVYHKSEPSPISFLVPRLCHFLILVVSSAAFPNSSTHSLPRSHPSNICSTSSRPFSQSSHLLFSNGLQKRFYFSLFPRLNLVIIFNSTVFHFFLKYYSCHGISNLSYFILYLDSLI